MILRILFLAFFLTGCTTVNQTTQTGPLYTYRADLQTNVNNMSEPFDGVGTWTLTAPVTINFSSPVAADRVQITTCARQHVCQAGSECDPNFSIEKTWDGSAPSSFSYSYAPTHAEAQGSCPMYVEIYSKKDLTSWGLINFRYDEKMASEMDCNGTHYTFSGVSTCQTKNGLEQLMSFSQKVAWTAEASCHATTTDQQNFKFVPDKGICRATFQGKDSTGGAIQHRLFLLGYDSVLVRD